MLARHSGGKRRGTLPRSALIVRPVAEARASADSKPVEHISKSDIGDRMAAGAAGASGMLRQARWSNQLAQRAPAPPRGATSVVPSDGFSAARWRTFG